jgi:hypothetical protein
MTRIKLAAVFCAVALNLAAPRVGHAIQDCTHESHWQSQTTTYNGNANCVHKWVSCSNYCTPAYDFVLRCSENWGADAPCAY